MLRQYLSTSQNLQCEMGGGLRLDEGFWRWSLKRNASHELHSAQTASFRLQAAAVVQVG